MDDNDIPAAAPSEWQPTTCKVDLAVLGKLGEEVSECSSALFRCITQGIGESEPVTGKPNREWLEDEIADVLALSEHVMAHFGLDRSRIEKRRKLKYAYKAMWYDTLRLAEMSGRFWYLATPYSKYPHGIEAAFRLAAETRGLLLSVGVPCFSPIVHSHPVAAACGMDPLDHAIWLPSEAPILAAAHGLIMLRAESWEYSYGMNEERKLFESSDRPVVWMDPRIVPKELTDSAA